MVEVFATTAIIGLIAFPILQPALGVRTI